MREFALNNANHVLCLLLLGARLLDVGSTYLASPTLRLESNPVARRFGWPYILLSLLACLLPYWNTGVGMMALVVSLWVSADNISRVWFIRALGEQAFAEMVAQAERRGALSLRILMAVMKACCILVMGIVLCFLTYESSVLPLSYWFGMGIISYGLLNLLVGLRKLSGSGSVPVTTEDHHG